MLSQDGVYDRTKPWDSMAEQLVSESLSQNTQPNVEAAGFTPKLGLFPDRFGYEQRPLNVEDCFAIETRYGDARDDFSRVTSGYQGTSFPALGVM